MSRYFLSSWKMEIQKDVDEREGRIILPLAGGRGRGQKRGKQKTAQNDLDDDDLGVKLGLDTGAKSHAAPMGYAALTLHGDWVAHMVRNRGGTTMGEKDGFLFYTINRSSKRKRHATRADTQTRRERYANISAHNVFLLPLDTPSFWIM